MIPKLLLAVTLGWLLKGSVLAQNAGSYPYTLASGTTVHANQVAGDLNHVLSSVENSPLAPFLLRAQYKFSGPNAPDSEARPMDCSKAPNPEYCALHNQAQLACREKTGPDYRRCLNAQLPGPPPVDCSRQPAEARASCDRQAQARASCQGKTGDLHLACMKEALGSLPP